MNRRQFLAGAPVAAALSSAELIELDRLVREQAEDLDWLDRVERQYPLATSVLWRAPKAEWDQRRAVIEAMRAPRVALIKGGWRSGKSEGLKQLTVACAMGGSHPAVRAWLAVNDLPTDVIPDAPSQVYAIAQSSNDSLLYHRDDFDRLVGPASYWSNKNGKGQAKLEIEIPGSKAVGKIWFKSIDQKRKAFQGISIRYAFIDEEPYSDDGYGVYDELRARVADQGGRIGMAYVPMEGITWVYQKLERDKQDDARVVELDALDNPHLPDTFASLYTGMSDDDIQVRRYGRYRSRAGAVYPMFTQTDGNRWGPGHMCDDFPIPDDWPRYSAADLGLVNPTAVGWGALGDDDTLYIYREYYQPNGESYRWHGERIKAMQAGEIIQASWGDPSAKDALDEFAGMDLYFDKANNAVKFGIDAVKDRLRIRGDNRPRLKIFRSCTNHLREMQAYLWDSKRKDEAPLKQDDHCPDLVRYLCTGLLELKGL